MFNTFGYMIQYEQTESKKRTIVENLQYCWIFSKTHSVCEWLGALDQKGRDMAGLILNMLKVKNLKTAYDMQPTPHAILHM